jgi:hypothetical protein
MSVARLCGKDFWVALPAMAAVVQIFVLGRLWIVNGYPTFDLPVAAVAAAVILPWRTTLSPWLNYFTVAGLTLVAAYTWYPLILLSAPALIATALRLIKGSSRRSQALSALAFACTGIAFLAPLIHYRGEAGKLSIAGASNSFYYNAIFTPGTPWALVVLSIAGLLGFVIVRRSRVGDGGLLAAPAVIGTLVVLYLVASEVSATHFISYYGQKFACGVFAICLIVLASAAATWFASSNLRRHLSQLVVAIASVFAVLAVLQVDGYVGPVASATRATPATGFLFHQQLDKAKRTSGDAQALLTAAQFAQDRPTSGTRWAFVNPEYASSACIRTDEWFYALSDELAISGPGEWWDFPCIEGDTATARYFVSQFPNPVAARIHLFVSASLAQAIIARNKAWNSPGVLYVIQTR